MLGRKITATSKSSFPTTSLPSKGGSSRKKEAQPQSITLSTYLYLSLSFSLSPIPRPREEKVEERSYLAGSGDEGARFKA
jgi:hypothetical protein